MVTMVTASEIGSRSAPVGEWTEYEVVIARRVHHSLYAFSPAMLSILSPLLVQLFLIEAFNHVGRL
jgi:hypothetical protein